MRGVWASRARSLIGEIDDETLWRREPLPLQRAGIVNRLLFEIVNQGGRGLAIKKFGRVDTGAAAFTGEQPVVSARAVALRGARCGTAAAITSIARIQGEHGEEEIPPIACAKIGS